MPYPGGYGYNECEQGIEMEFIINSLVSGWVIMLVIGMVWHEFGYLEPIGYGVSLGFGIAWTFLAAMFHGKACRHE